MREYANYNHQTKHDKMRDVAGYSDIYPYCKDSLVLDIGANIGAFGYQALKSGANKVVMIEASKRNYEFLEKQPFVEKYSDRITLKHRAIIGGESNKNVMMYEAVGSNTGCDSIHFSRGRGEGYEVSGVTFTDVINKVKPDVLKIDVEGAELDFDFSQIPDSVQAMAIEFHPNSEEEMEWFYKTESYLRSRWPNVLRMKSLQSSRKYKTIELVVAR